MKKTYDALYLMNLIVGSSPALKESMLRQVIKALKFKARPTKKDMLTFYGDNFHIFKSELELIPVVMPLCFTTKG